MCHKHLGRTFEMADFYLAMLLQGAAYAVAILSHEMAEHDIVIDLQLFHHQVTHYTGFPIRTTLAKFHDVNLNKSRVWRKIYNFQRINAYQKLPCTT